MAMMAITTNNSMSVKAVAVEGFGAIRKLERYMEVV
jgi:hypothetical protein